MKEFASKLNVKSFIIGVLAACLLFWLANGRSTQATTGGSGQYAIAADNEGVYIMKDGYVRFVTKSGCNTKSGCHFNTND